MTDPHDLSWRGRRAALHAFLAEHHAVVSSRELRTLGYSSSGVDRLLQDDFLVRAAHGIYRGAAAPMTEFGQLRADLLRAGPASALSRRSAAHLLGYLQYRPAVTQLVVPGTSGFRRSAALDRRAIAQLGEDDVRVVDGLRCLAPLPTILELAAECGDEGGRRVFGRVLRAAAAEDPALVDRLRETLRSAPFPGSIALRDALGGGLERTLVVRSGVEVRFVELCRRYGLPIPETNVTVLGLELDAYWRLYNAYVEIDTFGTHGDEVSFERDRQKAAKLAAAGIRGFGLTDRRIDHQPASVADDVRGLLGLV